MALAGNFAAKHDVANDVDPREDGGAEIIDFASRASYPVVSQRKGKSDALGLVGGIAVVALLVAATLWGMNAARTSPADQQQQAAAQPQPAGPAANPGQNGVPDPGVQRNASSAPVTSPRRDPAPSPVLAAPPQVAMGPVSNPYSSPTVVFDAGALPQAMGPGAVSAPAGDAGAGTGSASDFASRVGGVGGAAAAAARNFDPATTVTQGTLIPAVLETAIDTDVPGFTRAIVSQDVRSYDGRRILVPRSSRLIGQYQSGLQNGQKRAYVIWTRLIRPDGVSVALQSPATDFAGNTGLPGKVDNHFFKRFGSAMLLSVIGGLSTVASGGSSVVLGGGGGAAAAAINQGSNIGPTVRVSQGEPIRVFTARDLDFSQAPRL